MNILGCGRQCAMSAVRIFSTLILLVLGRFGEPIRMKHGRRKQHTGEGEEKDIEHSDVADTHTLCICLHETSDCFGSLQVQSEPPHPESLNASQPAQRHFFFTPQAWILRLHRRTFTWLSLHSFYTSATSFFFYSAEWRTESDRTSGDNAANTVESQPAARSGEGALPSAFLRIAAPRAQFTHESHQSLMDDMAQVIKDTEQNADNFTPLWLFFADSGSVKPPAAPKTVWWRITADVIF